MHCASKRCEWVALHHPQQGVAMSCKTIIVNLAVDADPMPTVKFAAAIAVHFEAQLVGLAAADVPPLVATEKGLVHEGQIMETRRRELERRLSELRRTFEDLVPPSIAGRWMQYIRTPTSALITAARSADLIVTGDDAGDDAFRALDIGSLLLGAGRPVLLAAKHAEHVAGKTVLVAWKDCREARRALSDALPFLTRAREVVLATMAGEPGQDVRDSLADAALFLRGHGILARTEVLVGETGGHQLVEFAHMIEADLIVSGAYGHSRLREWAFGGITRSLMAETGINRFLSN